MEGLMIYAQSFFGWLLQTTLIASLVICLILLIQKILGDKLGPRWCHALWLVLLIRMILPWAPQSRLSLSNLIPSWDSQIQRQQRLEPAEQQKVYPTKQTDENSEAITSQEPESELATQEHIAPRPRIIANAEDQSVPRLVSLRRALPILWLPGAMVIGAYLLVSNFTLWRIVKRDRPLVNQAMLELFEECKAQMGVQSLVVVVPSDQVISPGLFGFVRPRLLLPREMLDTATAEEMRYVFLHELAHLKRHDIYLGWLTSLLQVLHWFNPLVWFAFYRMRADRELACDALVLTRTGQDKSQEYGGAILGLVRRFSRSRPLPAMAGIMESRSQLKRRIAMITQFEKNSYRWSPLAVFLVVILACISLPDAKRAKASETAASQSANQPKFTKIRIPYDAFHLRPDAQLSTDGKSIAFALEGKLWIMPTVGKLGPDYPGTPIVLNTDGIGVTWEGLAWSRDGRWIAFNSKDWIQAEKRMYVVSNEGGTPKKVYQNCRDSRVVNYRMSLSPDGKILAFSSVDANELHIYTIPVDGGTPTRLVGTPAREPVFSPDGKWIAYVTDKNLGVGGGDLWVVSAKGGTPRLVAEAGWASSPVWSPDGRMIAFLDFKDDKSNRQIYVVAVDKDRGHATEKMIIACPDRIDSVVRLTGWTSDNKIGAIFVGHPQYGLYTLPAEGGIATLVAHIDKRLNQPRWSPDDKRIICTSDVGKGRDGWIHNGLVSISAEGGEITTIPLQADTTIAEQFYGGGNHVSPDGKTIVFVGHRRHEEEDINHIWTLPIGGGRPKQLTNARPPLTDWYPCWSPNGKAIAFIRTKRGGPNEGFTAVDTDIFIISADGGEPRQLTSEADMVIFGYIAWSPDGKWLAYFSAEKDYPPGSQTLRVIPAAGGPSHVVGKLGQALDARMELAWSADSKKIAFTDLNYKIIKVMSLNDGSIAEINPRLADTHIFNLDWSHGGERLVFAGTQGGNLGFWMMENFLPEDLGK